MTISRDLDRTCATVTSPHKPRHRFSNLLIYFLCEFIMNNKYENSINGFNAFEVETYRVHDFHFAHYALSRIERQLLNQVGGGS